MAPFKNKLALNFLGTMNGSSTSHTNAWFMPNDCTLVFVDLSLLNLQKAWALIEAYKADLTHVIVCLTHTHADHVSGLSMLAFLVPHLLPEVTLEIIADSQVLMAARSILDSEGARTSEHMVIYRSPDQGKFNWDGQESIPGHYRRWFIRPIPTTHDHKLLAATGFLFNFNGTAVIYSGDTNTLTPFTEEVKNLVAEHTDHQPVPIELYLEAQTLHKWPAHLYLPDILPCICQMLDLAPELKVILMHYDDQAAIIKRCSSLAERFRSRIFIAEPTF